MWKTADLSGPTEGPLQGHCLTGTGHHIPGGLLISGVLTHHHDPQTREKHENTASHLVFQVPQYEQRW